MSKLVENYAVGALVAAFLDEGYRVELCDQDGGGLFLYAAPDAGEKPETGWNYWIRLIPGNKEDIIVDYTANLESLVAPVQAAIEALSALVTD